jgi:peptidoglycan/LPS O-acetylase OafA/YrhL
VTSAGRIAAGSLASITVFLLGVAVLLAGVFVLLSSVGVATSPWSAALYDLAGWVAALGAALAGRRVAGQATGWDLFPVTCAPAVVYVVFAVAGNEAGILRVAVNLVVLGGMGLLLSRAAGTSRRPAAATAERSRPPR